MAFKMKKILLTALIFTTTVAFPCTTFVIKNSNNLVFGRNLDWVSENGLIVVNQRNQEKQSIVFHPDQPIIWKSKYGSVTINQFGKELPFGGINEKGLVIEIMRADAEYSKTDNRKAVNELQWIQYQLDNSSNLDEVIANVKLIRIRKVSQELHFLVADKGGNVAVLEFKNGKMIVYKDKDLPFPVLENDAYATSLEKYKRGDNNTRFSRATKKVLRYNEKSNGPAIDYSFEILENVKLDGSWSIVYDIKNMDINFITKSNKQRKTVNLNAFDFSCSKKTLAYDLKATNKGTINDKFVELTYDMNKAKIQDAMATNRINLPIEIKEIFYRYFKTIECK